MIATLQDVQHQEYTPATRPLVAQLHGVTKNFDQIRALHKVDLSVPAGELVALLGPNGAGKTTAVKLLLGLTRPTSGSVRVPGGNPVQAEVRMSIGVMMQVAKVPETLRVREHIDLFSSYYPSPLPLEETLAIANLRDIKDRIFGELSGGQKQRLLFALAVCGNPDLLILDEPTVGLDVESRRLLWDQIRKLVADGKTVLLTTHYLEEADALADRIVVINHGEIAAEGSPTEIKSRASGRRIRCRTRLSVATVASLPGVLDVQTDREYLDIRVTEAEPVLRELLLRDSTVSGIEVTSAGLEDAFLALTQHNSNAEIQGRN